MRPTFDAQLELLDAQLLVMGTSVEGAVASCIRVLEDSNVQEADKIMEGDDDIDRQERDAESLSLKLLLTQQPVATDLRRVSAALKIAGDMERIGDQAADIAEIVKTGAWNLDFDLRETLVKLARRAHSMVHEAVEAYSLRDAVRARAVIESDACVNEGFDKAREQIVCALREQRGPAATLVDALMVAKHIERIGDYSKDVCFWIEYEVGVAYEKERMG